MDTYQQEYTGFKKAAILSIFVHILLFLFILLAPYLPKPSNKGMIHYVNLVGGLPGGGGGGGGGFQGGGGSPPSQTEEMADTEVPVSESLQNLTTPQKALQPETSSFRYPVDKPKAEPKPKAEKQAVVQKREPSKKTTSSHKRSGLQGSGSSGSGRGLSFGFGSGSGSGSGFGSGSGSGLANFPYAYYYQSLEDRIAGNWLQSRVSTLTGKDLYTEVSFRIQKDGSMTHLEVNHRCGIRALDMNALRAVQDSSPFPPLPREYGDEYLVVHLRFEHSQ
ncbi:MAG: TonB C-terminal domain-containing protein [Candidatus Aminicenantes bacterium]|nr:TonB C-terminal domain-containing protein [Candidatus Aminicenantes bacterium]